MLKFGCPLSTCESGVGRYLASFRPTGLMRFAGILLPAKQPGPPAVALHAPVASGSLMKTGAPLRVTPEKSPASSAAVGTRNVFCCGWLSTYFSPAIQKNVLFFR